MATKTLSLARTPSVDIDSIWRDLHKAWALSHFCVGQVQMNDKERCNFIWTGAVLEQIASLVRHADGLADDGPVELALSIHAARALCEVMASDAATVPGKQHLSDDICEGWLVALIDELEHARSLAEGVAHV